MFNCPACKKQIDPEEKIKNGKYISKCPECGKKIQRWNNLDSRNYSQDKKGTIKRRIKKVKISKAEKKAAIREKHNKE